MLLNTLRNQGFSFLTFEESLSGRQSNSLVLRHDVDLLPLNSLEFARIQADLRIKGSYYFRMVPDSYDENVVKEIASHGHEIGYHYEDVGVMAQWTNGAKAQWRKGSMAQRREEFEKELIDMAIDSFSQNLEKLRKIVPVKTICMHGSPMSRWDSRLLWKYYDYKDFGIIGEPYFDVDFDKVLYLTDTGRRWDGDAVSIRDSILKVEGGDIENPFIVWKVKPIKYRNISTSFTSKDGAHLKNPQIRDQEFLINKSATKHQIIETINKFHSTSEIIKAVENKQLPGQIMMTFHPQRWTDKPLLWVKELLWQNLKNGIKYYIVKAKLSNNLR